MSNQMLSLVTSSLKRQTLSYPDTVLPPSYVVAAVTWEIEAIVKEAQWQQLDLGNSHPDLVLSQVLQWVHTSQVACHLEISHTLSLMKNF